GRGETFTGAACAKTLNASRKVTVRCAPDVPGTTTTTSSSTTSTSATTTTTTPTLCGNGVIDPGEECDGSAFGAFMCPPSSPSGVLLCTDDCKIDFSRCPEASTTTTTTTSSTTTTPAPTTTTTTDLTTTTPTSSSTTTSAPTTTTTTTTGPTTTELTTTTTQLTTTTTEATTTTTSTTTTTEATTTTTTTSTTTTTIGGLSTLDFTLLTGVGNCGTTRNASNTVLKNLVSGTLYIGGGGSVVPARGTPNGSLSRLSLTSP